MQDLYLFIILLLGVIYKRCWNWSTFSLVHLETSLHERAL